MPREIVSVLTCSFVMGSSSSIFAFGHVYTGPRVVRYFSKVAALEFHLLQEDFLNFNDQVLVDSRYSHLSQFAFAVNLPVACRPSGEMHF